MTGILVRTFGIVLALSVAVSSAEEKHMEARVYVQSVGEAVQKLGSLYGELDITTAGETRDGRSYVVVIITEEQLAQVRAAGLEVEVTWPDILDKFEAVTGVKRSESFSLNFGYFLTYAEMYDSILHLRQRFPSLCTLYSIGASYQGKPLWTLKISDNPSVDEAEPACWFNGATHAREPMGTHMCVDFACYLLNNYATDSVARWIVNNREIYLTPVMNPDGYCYNSDSAASNGYWRKNRRPVGSGQIGVDLNRNYGFKWGYDNIGSSPTRSSETYRGDSAFSEVETKRARALILSEKLRTGNDFHTYGQYNLMSWDYITASQPPDSLVLREMLDTLRANNQYPPSRTGQTSRVLYTCNGASGDYEVTDTIGSTSKFRSYALCTELDSYDFYYGWNDTNYIKLDMNRNRPNCWYMARITGVFFQPRSITVNDTPAGNRTNQLDPGETANLWFRVRNRAIHPLDSAYQVSGKLRSLSSYVTVLDSVKSFPRCLRRDSTDDRANQFRVACDVSAPPGTVVPLRLELAYKDDTLTMMQPVNFSITIGANPIYTLDVGCTRLPAPAGAVDSGVTVVPACSVYNYGNGPATYNVRMCIGAGYNQTATVTSHAPGSRRYVTFPNWTAQPVGMLSVRCSTELAGDTGQANNRQTGTVDVRRQAAHDVGCVRLMAPAGSIDSGASVVPACSLFNYGNQTESYQVRMRVGSSYSLTASVASHGPGTARYVTFPSWTAASRGSHAVSCSTELTGDGQPANDRQTGSVDVLVHDIGSVSILAPTGTIPPGSVMPRATIHNHGTVREAADATFSITSSPTYTQTVTLTAGVPFADTVIEFPAWAAITGSYVTRCSTYMATDQIGANNVVTGSVAVSGGGGGGGWHEVSSMPGAPSGKYIKDGGWLACDGDLILGAKGNKTGDFYSYDALGDTWHQLALIPSGTEGKPPYKGATGGVAYVGGCRLAYATKGNNTSGFYGYTASTDSWKQLKDVPLGPSNKKVKGGTDMVYVTLNDTGYVYLMKGYKAEFYRYNTLSDTWQSLPDVPGTPKCDKGSFLAYDGAGLLYAHKAKYHELNAFDATAGAWGPALKGMPFLNSIGRSKKSKDGGCGVFDGTHLWALKGGNTQEFWKYFLAGDSWTELETIPAYGSTLKKKKVKAGADIVADNDGMLYATKGNKANELWRYQPAAYSLQLTTGNRDGVVTSSVFGSRHSSLAILPNPLASGHATLRYNLPAAGPVSIIVFDVTGRQAFYKSIIAGRTGTTGLDLMSLSAGVYLVRLTSGTLTVIEKLVVKR